MSTENTTNDMIVSPIDKNTAVVTSNRELTDDTFRSFYLAMNQFDTTIAGMHSIVPNAKSGGGGQELTLERFRELSVYPQSDLKKTTEIIDYINGYVNSNFIIGRVVEIIESSVNAEIRHQYTNIPEGRNKLKQFEAAQDLIRRFDSSVRIKDITRKAITTAYREGNWVCYLRHDLENYVIDVYPLEIAVISNYTFNGEPVVQINIKELEARLRKQYPKTKKKENKFFDNLKEEIENGYPPEVFEAWKAKEDFCRLDPRYTFVIRTNNMDRLYGLSALWRAIPDLLLLEDFDEADRQSAKKRKKTILHQLMRKETVNEDGKAVDINDQKYNHSNLVMAFKNQTTLVTTNGTVEEIKYIEPKQELTDKDAYNLRMSKILTTLGVSFSMDTASQSVSTAKIGCEFLMKLINSNSEQWEFGLKKFYRQILMDNNFDPMYAPEVQIIDSEMLENTLKMSFAQFMFSNLGASRETVFNMVGLDVKDEAEKRKKENELDYSAIFEPYASSFTLSASDVYTDDSNKGGRPKDDDGGDKQEYDETYNQTRE